MRRTCLWCPIMKRKEIVMWIHVCPNWKTYFYSKNGYKRSFSYESKASISFIPLKRLCWWCIITKTKDIIVWIQVYRNWKMKFNSKNSRRRGCFMKPKHQYHLSQWGECAYDAQSWNERRLLCESVSTQINWHTLILKRAERDGFLVKPKQQYH